MTRPLHWLLDFWFGAIPSARWVLWQRLFGMSFLYFVTNWGLFAREWLTDYGYHVSEEAANSVFPDPMPLLSEFWLQPFLVLMYGAALCVTLNIQARLSSLISFGCAVYIQFADQTGSFTLNKLYILGFALLAFGPKLHRIRDDAGNTKEYLSVWAVRVIQATLIIQYGDAGICKAFQGDWLQHPDILYGHSVGVYRTEIAGILIQYMPNWFWVASSQFALAFEMGAPLWFMVPQLRKWTLVAGIGMHIVIAVLMKDLIFFSFQMCTFYALFLSDERAERWIARWDYLERLLWQWCLEAVPRALLPKSKTP